MNTPESPIRFCSDFNFRSFGEVDDLRLRIEHVAGGTPHYPQVPVAKLHELHAKLWQMAMFPGSQPVLELDGFVITFHQAGFHTHSTAKAYGWNMELTPEQYTRFVASVSQAISETAGVRS